VTATNGVTPPASQTLTLTVRRHAAKADNHFTVTGVRVGRGGKVTFLATVNASGSITAVLTAAGHARVGETHSTVKRPGGAQVHVSPTAAGRRLFRSAPSSLNLALDVMFRPDGGSPRTIRLRGLRLP
jgi:hypothetical protein